MANFCRRVGDRQAWSWCFDGDGSVKVKGDVDAMDVHICIVCPPASALDNWRVDMPLHPYRCCWRVIAS